MPTHVYANNNEIASKASDGKSIAAFPDVCISPPAPPAGPIPLPYPNTGECTNTDQGTSKVFIQDKMSGMEGVSCLSQSMGDEAATQNFNKGMITSALQGKCYFGLWSMDVRMEGKSVPRHLDMVTHNHASQPPQCTKSNQANGEVKSSPKQAEKSGIKENCNFKAYFVDSNNKVFSFLSGVSINYKKINYTAPAVVHISTYLCVGIEYSKMNYERGNIDFYSFLEKNAELIHCYVNSNNSISDLVLANSKKNLIVIVHVEVPKPMIIFIGGAGDKHSKLMHSVSVSYQAEATYQEIKYFRYSGGTIDSSICYNDQQDIIDLVHKSWIEGRKVAIIGHSWGGDTAYNEVIAELKPRLGKNIELLVTLDPVSIWFEPSAKPTFVKLWYNVYVKGPISWSNAVAFAGGNWNYVSCLGEQYNILIENGDHGNASGMFQHVKNYVKNIR